jgi:HD domain
MDSIELLAEALLLAEETHRGQIDSDGEPHFVHCLQVMRGAMARYLSASIKGYSLHEIMAAAILHDTIEDSKGKVTAQTISEKISPRVADIVVALTRLPDEEYKYGIYRVRNFGYPAIDIKNADLDHNLGRNPVLKLKHPRWAAKLEKKYKTARKVLASPELDWEEAEASWNDLQHLSFILTIADCQFDEIPKCAHCDAGFPKNAEVELSGDPRYVVVECVCRCVTPFKVKTAQTDKLSEANLIFRTDCKRGNP